MPYEKLQLGGAQKEIESGSRNIGKELAERHISTAKSLWRLSELPSPDLAYFIHGTP